MSIRISDDSLRRDLLRNTTRKLIFDSTSLLFYNPREAISRAPTPIQDPGLRGGILLIGNSKSRITISKVSGVRCQRALARQNGNSTIRALLEKDAGAFWSCQIMRRFHPFIGTTSRSVVRSKTWLKIRASSAMVRPWRMGKAQGPTKERSSSLRRFPSTDSPPRGLGLSRTRTLLPE